MLPCIPLIEPVEWVELLDAASWAKQAPLTANAPSSATSILEEIFMVILLQALTNERKTSAKVCACS
jgi:hypothetical protein